MVVYDGGIDDDGGGSGGSDGDIFLLHRKQVNEYKTNRVKILIATL